MKTTLNKFIICLTVISTIGFISCNDNLDLELSIQDKITLLENGEWLPKGFVTNVMHAFSNGERFTYYGSDSVFSDPAIPGTEAYAITDDLLTIDFNFGTITYELIFSCDDNIVEFFEDGELKNTLYKRGSNYEKCL